MIRRAVNYFGFLILLSACNSGAITKEFEIRNDLDIDRIELVSVDLSLLGVLPKDHTWLVTSGADSIVSQMIDYNSDSIMDELVFISSINANSKRSVSITAIPAGSVLRTERKTFSRFVPERIDDYAWENDLVAFRTYGPEAQRLTEAGEPGGTLSSGLDCWLKRVEYPIIDNWYEKYVNGSTYHKDDGEGYDPYHVGNSRGCGGIGILIDDSLFVSKNFVSYKSIAAGPLRNIFELTYASWQAGTIAVNETKRITIDLGNQLFKVEEKIDADGVLPNVTIGLTLHEGNGIVMTDSLKGICSYWEVIDDSELGTGIVVDTASLSLFKVNRTAKKDQSQLYAMVKAKEQFAYYTGFAWKKANKITTTDQWNRYLDQFAQRINSPLIVTLK